MVGAPRLDPETNWKLVEILSDAASSFRAVIERSETHGLFRYSVESYFGPIEEDWGQWPEGFWRAHSYSGLYGSLVEVAKEARVSIEAQWNLVAR